LKEIAHMNDREILAAALRWHTVHERRMAASSKLYEHKKAEKQRTGYFSSDCKLSLNVTEAKRVERAALRVLAKVCEKVRGNLKQVDDANEVFDVEVKLLK
jgi:hypothetical protein